MKNVGTHELENRMESFFLAETTKYLYLLFDADNFIHNNGSSGSVIQTPNGECVIDAGGYFFNTEAHPIDVACVYCCSAQKKEDDRIIQGMHEHLDLLSVLGIVEPSDTVPGTKWKNLHEELEQKRQQEEKLKLESLQREINLKLVDSNSKDESKTDSKETVQVILGKETGGSPSAKRDNQNIEVVRINASQQTDSDKMNVTNQNLTDVQKSSQDSSSGEDNAEKKDEQSQNVEKTQSENLKTGQTETVKSTDAEKLSDDKKKVEKHAEDTGNKKTDGPSSPKVVTKSFSEHVKEKTAKHQALNSATANLDKLFTFILNTMSNKESTEKVPNIYTLYKMMQYYPLGYKSNPEMMVCPAQPFHMRMSAMGEMFHNDRN